MLRPNFLKCLKVCLCLTHNDHNNKKKKPVQGIDKLHKLLIANILGTEYIIELHYLFLKKSKFLKILQIGTSIFYS